MISNEEAEVMVRSIDSALLQADTKYYTLEQKKSMDIVTAYNAQGEQQYDVHILPQTTPVEIIPFQDEVTLSKSVNLNKTLTRVKIGMNIATCLCIIVCLVVMFLLMR